MWRTVISVLLVGVCGCAQDGDDGRSGAPAAGPPGAGRVAYEAFCASCHDTGKDDAPVRGQADNWTQRSQLWQAVLMEHANKGYLEMPAKGGTPELSDETVALATEYILETTFTDRPQD